MLKSLEWTDFKESGQCNRSLDLLIYYSKATMIFSVDAIELAVIVSAYNHVIKMKIRLLTSESAVEHRF